MDKYWRQIGACGIELISFLSVGMKGVGMETGKHLVLSGMEAVDIGDSGPVVMADVNSKRSLSGRSVAGQGVAGSGAARAERRAGREGGDGGSDGFSFRKRERAGGEQGIFGK